MLERITKQIKFPESFDGNVLVFTDLHFHKHKSSNIFLPIIENVLVGILDIIKAQKIKMVWFLGDWFENKEKIGTEEFVMTSRFFNELSQLGIVTILIPGNHDKFLKSNSKTTMNTVESFGAIANIISVNEPMTVEYLNKVYHFMPHTDTLKKEELEKMIEKGKDNYLIGHPELNDITMSNDMQSKITTTDVDVNVLNSLFKLCLLGHYHNSKKYGNVITPGSPYQMNFGESSNTNYVMIFNLNTDKITTIKNTKSPKFRKFRITDLNVNTIEDVEKLDIKDSFVRILLNKAIDHNLLLRMKEHLGKQNLSVEILFDYDNQEEVNISQSDADDLKKKLMIVDLSSSKNMNDFFLTYLDIFKQMPEGIDKETLRSIIQDNV